MSDAGRTLTSNSVISVLGTGISAVLSMLFVSLGARWLGPAEYGSVGALVSFGNVLQLTLGPVEAALTLRVATLVGERRLAELAIYLRANLRALSIAGAAVLVCWGLAGFALTRPDGAYPRAGVQWLGGFCVAALVACLPRALMRGRESFRALSENAILESGLRLALGLALIKLVGGASSMLAAYALAGLAALLHGISVMGRGLPAAEPVQLRGKTWAEITAPFRELTAPLLVLHAYAAFAVNVDVLVAKHFLSPRQAGLYAGATSLSRIMIVVATPLSLVLFSRLATLSAARRDTKRTFLLGALIIAGGLLLSLLIPGLFGDALLRFVLGDAYRDASPVLFCQWATACAVTLHIFLAESMLATSRVRAPLLLLLPALASLASFAFFHASPLQIAQVSLVTTSVVGTLSLYVLARLRVPHAVSS